MYLRYLLKLEEDGQRLNNVTRNGERFAFSYCYC